jgi:hypothetical protein
VSRESNPYEGPQRSGPDPKEGNMRTHVSSIEIAASVSSTYEFVADLERLPVWAIGFAKAIERSGDRFVVTTAGGDRLGVRAISSRELGVVDYLMSPAPDVEFPAHTRVVPHGDGSLYTFVMHQPEGMPDAVFDQQAAELDRELTVLKAHLETSCPL